MPISGPPLARQPRETHRAAPQPFPERHGVMVGGAQHDEPHPPGVELSHSIAIRCVGHPRSQTRWRSGG